MISYSPARRISNSSPHQASRSPPFLPLPVFQGAWVVVLRPVYLTTALSLILGLVGGRRSELYLLGRGCRCELPGCGWAS